MAKGDRPRREAKKPKKEKAKTGAVAPPPQIVRTPPSVAVPSSKQK